MSEILQAPEINSVAIATPAITHGKIALQALMSGKHTFVEKPLCLNIEQGKKLREVSSKKNLILMVGHLLLYHPAFETLLEMVRKNKIMPHLNQLIKSIDSDIKELTFPQISKTLIKMIKSEGSHGIISYLATKKLNNITPDLILLLDALRSVLKFSGLSKDSILAQLLNSPRDSIHV